MKESQHVYAGEYDGWVEYVDLDPNTGEIEIEFSDKAKEILINERNERKVAQMVSDVIFESINNIFDNEGMKHGELKQEIA